MRIYDDSKKRTITRMDLRTGTLDYYEVPYTEYRQDGTIREKGTEDFLGDRYHFQTSLFQVRTWDGKTYGANGERQFEPRGTYRIHGTPAELRTAYLTTICKDATPPADVSIRKIF